MREKLPTLKDFAHHRWADRRFLAYGLDKAIAVYDLGGERCDVSDLEIGAMACLKVNRPMAIHFSAVNFDA